MKVVFDTRELYHLTQFVPVQRVLAARGVACEFTFYENRPTQLAATRQAVERLGLPARWFTTREEALADYQRQQPAWLVFGKVYPHLAELPKETRTAQIYHGIGTKNDVYSKELCEMDVRFIEGPYYERRLRELFPRANLVPVGYAKVDPFLYPEPERPRLDLAALGLDPAKRTLLYAPTHMPSSFPKMADEFPAHFADFNLLVKPHSLSFFGSKKKSHRRLMELWSRAPNVHVAPFEAYDPLPYMAAAELLISDESSVLFEFAVLDRPIVWCDFLWVHWTRRGPLAYRYWRRMDKGIQAYRDLAAHAARYRDLRSVVEAELAVPGRYREARQRCVRDLIGPADGRASERIADYLLSAPPSVERRAFAYSMPPT